MRARVVAGVACCLVGGVWIAQGTNALGGSFMSGEGQWTAIGGVLVAVGVGLLVSAARL